MDFDDLPFTKVDDSSDDLPFEPINLDEESEENSIQSNNSKLFSEEELLENPNSNKDNNIVNISLFDETQVNESNNDFVQYNNSESFFEEELFENPSGNKDNNIDNISLSEEKSEYIPLNSKKDNQNISSIDIDFSFKNNKNSKNGNIFRGIPEKLKGALNVLPVIAFTFVSILGIYIYSINAKADQINLIRIEENNKVGYINESGEVLAQAKYISGTDFYKGYAIVKNYNNLSGILNGKAKLEVPFGNFFYVDLYKNRYIVSKFTDEGLKQGLLDENLNEITRFKYDNISYSRSGLFLFTRDETMGIMNAKGKEIYTYEVSEVDDRNISIEVSDITNSSTKYKYARIKINSSSTIVNVETGKEVYKYTLDDIYVLDNNVFYVKNEDMNNRYIVINNDKVIYETTNYKRLRVEDINSNIAIGIKEDASIDYINLKNRKIINSNENISYTYSNGVMLSSMHNFTSDKDEYTIFTPDKILGTFTDIKQVDNTFVNEYSKIRTDNDKYGFINKKGKIITDKEYDTVDDFTSYGYAVVSNDNEYGVINTDGKEIINMQYDEIIMLNETLFNNIKRINNQEIFIFRVNDKYGIINSKGKILIKPIYDSFSIITNKYPIIKATYNGEDILINVDKFEELTMKISNNVNIYENYIVIGKKYYNYSGKLIYTAK